MIGRLRPFAAAAVVAAAAVAQVDQLGDHGYVALHQAVRDAGADQLVLLVASHPDDQYLYPAAVLRFRHGMRVAVALLTRGEGGQNIAGPETGDALARLRTVETARCAARLGIAIHHLDRPDRGYCRTAEEALDLWGRLSTTHELARLIRRLRPDAVITTHHPDEDHGHDKALLRILPDAVLQAASATHRYADLEPWSVATLLRGCAEGEAADTELDGDEVDPVRGDTLRRLAYAALQEHRSQMPHRAIDDLYAPVLRLHHFDGVTGHARELLGAESRTLWADLADDGIGDGVWRPIRDALERMPRLLVDATELVDTCWKARSGLLALATGARTGVSAQLRARRRIEAVETALLHAMGVVLELELPAGATVPRGEQLPLRLRVRNGGGLTLRTALRLPHQGEEPKPPDDGGDGGGEPAAVLAPGAGAVLEARWRPPEGNGNGRSARHVVDLPVQVEIEATGHAPLLRTFPLTVEVAPTLDLDFTASAVRVPRGRVETRLALRVRSNSAQAVRGTVRLRGALGLQFTPEEIDVDLPPRQTTIVTLGLRIPPTLRPGVYWARARLDDAAGEVPVHLVDVTVPDGLRVGLIPGVDDSCRRMLEDLGVELHILDGDDVATFPLEQLDTVLIDIRALRVQETARACAQRLLDFVHGGGRLVMLYHKDRDVDPSLPLAPYPLRIGRGRVTQEDAPVRVLDGDHPLLRTPNQVRFPQDWDGWVQERGLYFADAYDARYEELIGTADAGAEELRGGLLYARAGAGEWIYCALALHRQLEVAHPGACRLFANLVSHRR